MVIFDRPGRLRRLASAAREVDASTTVTFHRAIDQTRSVAESLSVLLELSLVDRVLHHDTERVYVDEVMQLDERGIMVVPDAVAARLQVERG